MSSLLVKEISFMKVTKIFKQKYHGCSKPIWHQWGHFAHISEPSEIWSNFFSNQKEEWERHHLFSDYWFISVFLVLLSSIPSLEKLIFNFHQIWQQSSLTGCQLSDIYHIFPLQPISFAKTDIIVRKIIVMIIVMICLTIMTLLHPRTSL